jgi:hypothetical protein
LLIADEDAEAAKARRVTTDGSTVLAAQSALDFSADQLVFPALLARGLTSEVSKGGEVMLT